MAWQEVDDSTCLYKNKIERLNKNLSPAFILALKTLGNENSRPPALKIYAKPIKVNTMQMASDIIIVQTHTREHKRDDDVAVVPKNSGRLQTVHPVRASQSRIRGESWYRALTVLTDFTLCWLHLWQTRAGHLWFRYIRLTELQKANGTELGDHSKGDHHLQGMKENAREFTNLFTRGQGKKGTFFL